MNASNGPPTDLPQAGAGPAAGAEGQPKTPKFTGCRDDEQTLFQCTAGGSEIMAVCGSKELTTTTGYVQFRRGTFEGLSQAEPKDESRADFRRVAVARMVSFEGGGGAYIRFDTGTESPRSLTVYSAIGDGFEEAGFVTHEGQQVYDVVKCDDRGAKLASDVFPLAGLAEGPDGLDFELPAKP